MAPTITKISPIKRPSASSAWASRIQVQCGGPPHFDAHPQSDQRRPAFHRGYGRRRPSIYFIKDGPLTISTRSKVSGKDLILVLLGKCVGLRRNRGTRHRIGVQTTLVSRPCCRVRLAQIVHWRVNSRWLRVPATSVTRAPPAPPVGCLIHVGRRAYGMAKASCASRTARAPATKQASSSISTQAMPNTPQACA